MQMANGEKDPDDHSLLRGLLGLPDYKQAFAGRKRFISVDRSKNSVVIPKSLF